MTVHANQTVLEKDVLFIIKSNAQWLNNYIFSLIRWSGVVNIAGTFCKTICNIICPTLYDRIDLQIAPKRRYLPKTLLSIMENHKWDQA